MGDNQQITTLEGWGDDVFGRLSWFRQEKVAAARVMVVGCGALGNEVLKNLVLFGIQHLVIVDFDQVEMSNLTRSIFFSREDAVAHRNKVDVLAERLQCVNPSIEVQTVFGDVAYDVGLGLLRRMDVVICCVDSRWTRYCVNRLCMRAGVPWVDGGIDALEGTARVFVPGENCYACNLGPEGLTEMKRRMPCSGIIRRNEAAGRVPTTPVVASVIGAVEVQEALKLIHREEMAQGTLTSLCGRMFYYEGQHMTTQTVHFRAYDEDCPVHERWEPVVPTALRRESTVAVAMDILRRELQATEAAIVLANDCFVDYITDRHTDQRYEVMCAGHLVARCVERNRDLQTKPLGAFYQHEYHRLDASFPYPDLTLADVGVPSQDVLHVSTAAGEYYIELSN